MAITKIGGPDTNVNPAYNPLVYYFDSTNKTEEGFRYIIEVFKAGTTQKLFEKTLIPDFDDRKCVLNLNREMQDFLSYEFDLSNLDTGAYDARGAYYRFDLDIGEEYVETWDWDDFGFAGSANWPNWGDPQYNPNSISRTMLFIETSTPQPPYQNGDFINVTLNPGTQDRPSVQGTHKVLDVFNSSGSGGVYWAVVLDLPWVGSGVSAGGSTTYADFRKIRYPNLLGLNGEGVYNTVFKVDDFLEYDSTIYNILTPPTTDKLILSQLPDNYKVREDNTMFIQYMAYDDATTTIPQYVKFSNDTGDSSILAFTLGVNRVVWGLDVSPTRTSWGTVSTGTLPIIKPTTESYSFQLLDINQTPMSKEYTIQIDRSCDIHKSTMEMVFMDKMGSFLPYNFTHRNTENQDVERSDYTRYLGGYNSTTNKFDYDLTDGGTEIYNSEYSRSFTLRTGFLNEKESIFFQNVLHSPVTYLRVDGKLRRCTITSNRLTVKKDKWHELIEYTLTVDISQKEMINI